MPTYKLIYFNLMGRAEVARLIFAEAGVEYEDCRLKEGEWPAYKEKTPFGQLPVLQVDGVDIAHSNAINRYLANEFGFAGENNVQKALIDGIADGLADVSTKLLPAFGEKDAQKKKDLMAVATEEHIKPFLTRYQRILDKNGTGYFVGDKLTWADLSCFHMMGYLRSMQSDIFDKFPKLNTFLDDIGGRDKIKAWVDKRPKTYL